MTPLTFEELVAAARKLVYALGISLWVRDGRIWQHGPGEEIVPAAAKETSSHGRFELLRVEASRVEAKP